MEYRTVVGVEIATVGMDWHASTGDFTCTFEHLADAAKAANEDPLIMSPRLKLGHTSEINGELRVVDPFAELGDGAPAFGRVINLRLESAGAKLIGDFIEVPEWLAEALPSAYPSRSMECRQFVSTEGNRQYSAVITAVSLLGPQEPAIKDLADLERFLIHGPEWLAETDAAAAATDPEEGSMPAAQIDASVATGTIRERFNWDWAMSDPVDGLDTYYWWARDVRVDPMEVIADDTEGGTWSVPFETDGKDEVTFGEPVKVREEFVPVNASAGVITNRVRQHIDQRVLASNLERPEKPAPKPAASAQPDNEEDTMDAKAIRESLGLAEDATDEEVIAKGQELREAATEAEQTEETTETPETTEAEEPVAASVDPDALEQLKSDAAAGREARTTQLSAERDSLIEAAVKAGKFAPAVAASYRAQLDKGGEIEASTRRFIDELAENVVPVTEMGASHENDQGHVGRVLASFGINRG